MQIFWNILISWGPMLLLIGVWVFFMRRVCGMRQERQEYMVQVKKYLTEHLAETQRINQNLDRIANALEHRQA